MRLEEHDDLLVLPSGARAPRAGFKDQAIARNLDVSLRTVRRRLSNLMAAHGLTSRFQLGQLAVQRGWV